MIENLSEEIKTNRYKRKFDMEYIKSGINCCYMDEGPSGDRSLISA